MNSHRMLAILIAALVLLAPSLIFANDKPLLVFTAASTTDAMNEVGHAFSQQSGIRVNYSFAASSTLAKQVIHGAPADVYISANQKWMDYLVQQKMIVDSTRVDILRNRLALIAPKGSGLNSLIISPGLDLRAALAGGRLALGDPGHVPAGIYAKEALAKLGLWDSVNKQIAAGATVRAALALVERGEAPLGAVYVTDARISPRVKVVGMFPPGSHSAISYPAAIVAGKDSPRARAYLEFLRSPQAKTIFQRHGFLVE